MSTPPTTANPLTISQKIHGFWNFLIKMQVNQTQVQQYISDVNAEPTDKGKVDKMIAIVKQIAPKYATGECPDGTMLCSSGDCLPPELC